MTNKGDLNGEIYSIIANAVGFALAQHDNPERIHSENGNMWVDVSDDDVERAKAVAKHVYVHLAELGYLPYV